MKFRIISLCLALVLALSACGKKNISSQQGDVPTGNTASLGDNNESFGQPYDDLGVYDGQFSQVIDAVTVTCVSGSPDCCTVTDNTITFTALSQDSVYAISGQFQGNIVIDVGDDYKLDLEMQGFSLISDSINPITVLSGNEVSLTAKKDFENYIYDQREAIDEADESLYSAAIYSLVDLEICGKGSLTLVSENNNGIHTKDDLQVKNLTLTVACKDNALKGNDSVTVENANTTLIATCGDGIKTTNSNISEKGNQRGTVTISGGSHEIYAACDGIDAAYDVVIQDDSTVLNIYTDKYSSYSEEVTAVSGENYYIRFNYNQYHYSIKYYNSDTDYCWVDAQYHSSVSGGRSNYYYYSYPIMEGYSKVQFFIYSEDQESSQDQEYTACSDYLTVNSAYDTFALSARGNQLNYEWTNYTTNIQDSFGPGGMGGMGGGNTDKGDHSTKGIKANNQITISGGTIAIKAYDDAIHANSDNALENEATPLGNVTISGGNLTLYSNDDGVHADGTLAITGGYVYVSNSYEGLEGTNVQISGGNISVYAKDDGINATTTTGTAVEINGGRIFIYCSGDGIDSNSRTSYTGIIFNGGQTVTITTSSGNSAIDTEQGYTYNGGSVLAIMPSGGMTNEATHCQNFSKISTKSSLRLSSGATVTVSDGNNQIVALEMPAEINGIVIYLGDSGAKIATGSADGTPDENGVYWAG